MSQHFYFLYYFFDNPVIRILRVGTFFLIGVLVYLHLGNTQFVIHLIPFYFILILQEFFIHFKLEKGMPTVRITGRYKHIIDCVDFKMRARLERESDMNMVIKSMLGEHEVRYFDRFFGLSHVNHAVQITEQQVLTKAAEIVALVSGQYIHEVDIYASYLLVEDEMNKILFNNNITKDDVLVVLSWVRKQFGIDVKKRVRFQFSGSGVFDFFIFGWSAELSRYALNFTREVLSQQRAQPIGRVREYDILVTSLSKNSSSNALLVGRAGVGKETLISQFVLDSDEGVLPRAVSNKIVFKLYPERLLAGVKNEGDLEERFISLFSELAHAGNIILYIPNIENIFGGGGLNVDISGALIEYLKSSSIKIVGSTTEDSYKTYIYPKQEIKELFDVVEINEPDPEGAMFMVLEKARELERVNRIFILFSAIREACRLSDSYVNDGTAMPGRAIRLLEDVISFSITHGIKKITDKQVMEFVEEKTHIVMGKPNEHESEKLLDLENEIHKRIVSQNEAVKAVSDAMRRVRSGMKEDGKPIASFLFLGPTGVGKTETAKALALSYFGDEKNLIRLDMSEYQNPESIERFLGKSGGSHSETVADKVLNNPFSLILLDEFEKAYPRILDLFLQILDEGRLTDNLGRTVSFNNSIIIATSNAGSEFIREEYKEGVSINDVKQQLIEKIQQSNVFKPELINRFDDIIVFKPLSETEASEVAILFLQEVINRVSQQQIILTFDANVPGYIARSAYSVEFGARNIKRFIEQSVENQLSKLILSNTLVHGGSAQIVVEQNTLVIKV